MIAFALAAHASIGAAALGVSLARLKRDPTVAFGASGVAVGVVTVVAGHAGVDWRGEPVDGGALMIAGLASAITWLIVVAEARDRHPSNTALCGVACAALTWAASTTWGIPFALAAGLLLAAAGSACGRVPYSGGVRLLLALAGVLLVGGVSVGAIRAGEWSLVETIRLWPWTWAAAPLLALVAAGLAAAGRDHRSVLAIVPVLAGAAAIAIELGPVTSRGTVSVLLLGTALLSAAVAARSRYGVGAATVWMLLTTLALGTSARPAAGLAAVAGILGASALATCRPGDLSMALPVVLLPPLAGGAALLNASRAAFDHVVVASSVTSRLPWVGVSLLLPCVAGAGILIAGSRAAADDDGRADGRPPRSTLLGLCLAGVSVGTGIAPAWLVPGAPDPSYGGMGWVIVAVAMGVSIAWWMERRGVLPAIRPAVESRPGQGGGARRTLSHEVQRACNRAAIGLGVLTVLLVVWATVEGARVGFL